MFEVSFEHAMYDRDKLPWAPQFKVSIYAPIYRVLEENVGKWHVFTFANADLPNKARNGVLHYAQTQGWEITTSVNGSRLGVLRRR